MRRTGPLALVALGLAATPAFAQIAIPEFDDPSAWSRDVSDLGTVFYECLVPACAIGSTVSVNADAGTAAPVLDEMVATLPSTYVGLDMGVGDLVVTGSAQTRVRDLDILRYSFELVFTAALNPLDRYWKSGVVFDPEAGQLLSIVSSSQDEAAASNNFDAILKALVASR